MISAGRIVAGLVFIIVLLVGALISLSLRLPDASDPPPPTTLKLDSSELGRLRASIEAQAAELARLRESLQSIGTKAGAPADLQLGSLHERLARTERDLQEALAVLGR